MLNVNLCSEDELSEDEDDGRGFTLLDDTVFLSFLFLVELDLRVDLVLEFERDLYDLLFRFLLELLLSELLLRLRVCLLWYLDLESDLFRRRSLLERDELEEEERRRLL